MEITYQVLTPEELKTAGRQESTFGIDVLLGLSKTPKTIPSRYFYDEAGSELFRQITQLDDYYPTRCEREIFDRRKSEIAKIFGREPFNLIELGSGDGHKTNIIIEELRSSGQEFLYIPIDLSESAMQGQIDKLQIIFPDIHVNGIVSDYLDGLFWQSKRFNRRSVLLFLGSNIGNLSEQEAKDFLRSVWNNLNDGDLLLIGFDLKKDIQRLITAYSDSKGITAAFNYNLLHRINRELGGNFNVDRFAHHATYNPVTGAMESYLLSTQPQSVMINQFNLRLNFDAWEPIFTEVSHKYTRTSIADLAIQTGYIIVQEFTDSNHSFLDSIWRVLK